MVKIGCCARFFNRYENEVRFAKENGFDFMQLWYDSRGLCLHEDDRDFIDTIKRHGFPTIIHAVLNIDEFDEHVPKLLALLKELGHKELIIHPICMNQPIDEGTLDILDEKVRFALDVFNPEGITLHLENNSKLDPIFTDTNEIEKIFANNKRLEFILDIAHIDSMEHLSDMVHIKKPNILHIADKHFNVVHEHLPIGQGEMDFKHIFKNILNDFNGKIILEIVNTDQDIVNSKKIIESILKEK
ncbi:sugar phosphate isomerase/epimerase family protein [Lutispora thermophila]|uniref:Sugar phosphate isomerase/epimerase n=1 Tax=Lutispora thermophila DSM 19022 TaxID=1122184 RepID=A0A1M6EJZ5_9FIRM|nr:TIM barrel protein [Lutispora thermophila]SHI85821.1 Sugar phosphate isomerase/epimerase [Lutispora thermophila DSM 19022]